MKNSLEFIFGDWNSLIWIWLAIAMKFFMRICWMLWVIGKFKNLIHTLAAMSCELQTVDSLLDYSPNSATLHST